MRPNRTDTYYLDGIIRHRFTNGQETTTSTSGINVIHEDAPVAGSDGNRISTTAYQLRVRRVAYPQGKISGRYRNGQHRVYQDNLYTLGLGPPTGFSFYPSTDRFDSLQSSAQSAAMNDMKAQVANLAVFYAERMEAGALVLGIMSTTLLGLKRLRKELASTYAIRRVGKVIYSSNYAAWRKRFSNWYELYQSMTLAELIRFGGKRATAKYLEYVFGVRPLLDEMGSIIDAVSKPPRDQIVKLVRTRSAYRYTRVQSTKNMSNILVDWDGYRVERQSCRVTLKAEMKYPTLATAAQLGLTNPLSLAWELIPFSWAIDAFWPLGSWLESLDADLGWDIHPSSCVSFRATLKGVHNSLNIRPSVSWDRTSGFAKCSEDLLIFERRKFQSLYPLPRLQLSSAIPLLQTFANLSAIAVQLTNGGKLPRGARI